MTDCVWWQTSKMSQMFYCSFDIYPQHRIDQNKSNCKRKYWTSIAEVKCNCLSQSSTQPRTNAHSCLSVSTRFGTLFTSDLVPAALIWLLLVPVHYLSLLISQNGQITLSKWPLSLFFPLYLSHWWKLDATPPAMPVSCLIGVWYSEVVISRGRTRGCHSLWLL